MWKRHGSHSGQGPPVGTSPHFSRLNLSLFYVSIGLSLLHFSYKTCHITYSSPTLGCDLCEDKVQFYTALCS